MQINDKNYLGLFDKCNGFRFLKKKLAIIATTFDPASYNIYNQLLSLVESLNIGNIELNGNKDSTNLWLEAKFAKIGGFDVTIYLTDKRLVDLNNLELPEESVIFLSRHSSKDDLNVTTVHSLGNFGFSADLGGFPRKISQVEPILHKALLNELYLLNPQETTLEVTHHGPYLEIPSVFIEIGSNESRWKDPKLGVIIAKAIINALNSIEKYHTEYFAIGLGGTHYAREFTKLEIESPISIPIIVPKFNLEYIDDEMLNQLFRFSKNIILDWKGLGKEKHRILELLEKHGIGYFRTDKLKKYFRNFGNMF